MKVGDLVVHARRLRHLDDPLLLSDGVGELPGLGIGSGEGVAEAGMVVQTHRLLREANCFSAVSYGGIAGGRQDPGFVVDGR